MDTEILICECSSAEHQMVLHYNDEDKLVYVETHLVPLVWYKRLWLGIKYIFGYKCCYGNFEEMILSSKHAGQVYKLYRFLKSEPSKEEIAELAQDCDDYDISKTIVEGSD